MRMPEDILDRYIQGRCTAQEKADVKRWLIDAPVDELDPVMRKIWDQDPVAAPTGLRQTVWHELQMFISPVNVYSKRRLSFFRENYWLAVASVLLILGGWWLYNSGLRGGNPDLKEVVRSGPSQTWSEISTGSLVQKKIQLEDGTVVHLAERSFIKYQTPFNASHREIYLGGRAWFKVAKDSNRPFTVYTNALATTALGTAFTVSEDSIHQSEQVVLFEGKVVIRPRVPGAGSPQETFLLPGEEMIYETTKAKTIVRHRQGALNSSDSGGRIGLVHNQGKLRFNNTPLAEALDSLQRHFQIIIDYRRKDLIHKEFTGVIYKSDSPAVILQAIANMNGLRAVSANNGFRIEKN